MTANEMRNLFKELYDGASAQEMGFDDTEVNRFLNLSQDIIFDEKIFAFHNRFLNGFENSSKREVELNNLKRSLSLWKRPNSTIWSYVDYQGETDATVYFDKEYEQVTPYNNVLIELLPNILYILQDTVDLKKENKVIRKIRVKNINEDNINNIMNNPFMKPDKTVVYRTIIYRDDMDNNKVIKLFLPSGYEFNRWDFTYLKRPRKIRCDILNPNNQVNCELDELIHNDIVFKAVELALGSIGSQKFQIANLNKQQNVK